MHDNISLAIAPYHVSIPDHRVGAGPKRILSTDPESRLSTLKKEVKVQMIPTVDDLKA